MLNEAQRRDLSVTLRIVEESLKDIEQISNNGNKIGILYEVRNNIPQAVKDEVLKKIILIKDEIKILAEKFDLEKEYKEASREAFGKLLHCWLILQEAKTNSLKRYGDVAPGLEDALDPHLNIIIDLIRELEHLLQNIKKEK